MLKLVAAALALLALAGAVALWAYARSDDAAEAQTQVIRWVNVTVELPEESGLTVARDFWGMESTTPAIIIIPLDTPDTSVIIDAETGAILHDSVRDEDRAAIDEVLKTIRVSPLDRSTAPWPYSREPPNVAREEIGNISYIPPDPASGIRIISGTADPGGEYIEVNNGRSLVFIFVDSGDVDWEPRALVPEDKGVLDRFLSTIEHVENTR